MDKVNAALVGYGTRLPEIVRLLKGTTSEIRYTGVLDPDPEQAGLAIEEAAAKDRIQGVFKGLPVDQWPSSSEDEVFLVVDVEAIARYVQHSEGVEPLTVEVQPVDGVAVKRKIEAAVAEVENGNKPTQNQIDARADTHHS